MLPTDSATGFFGIKALHIHYQTFSLKLYKDQILFFYFLSQSLDRKDPYYQIVSTDHIMVKDRGTARSLRYLF